MNKKLLSISTLSLLISSSLFAEVPKDIAALTDREGTYTGSTNGKVNETTRDSACEIVIEKDEENSDSLHIDSAEYFETNVSLKDLKRTEKNGVATYETNNSSWKICGHAYPLLSYKKTMVVTKNSLTVKQVYYCAFDWSSTTSLETCTVK
jgi:hypothetical protein